MYQFSKSDEKNIYDPKGNELARFIKKKTQPKNVYGWTLNLWRKPRSNTSSEDAVQNCLCQDGIPIRFRKYHDIFRHFWLTNNIFHL